MSEPISSQSSPETPIESDTKFPAPWRRLAAMIYDSLLLLAISMAYGGLVIFLGYIIWGEAEALTNNVGFQLGWLISLLSFYYFFWGRAGQTLGMRAWRLQLRSKSSRHFPTLTQCILRSVIAPLGWACIVTALFHQQRQCLHDIYSGTELVLTEKNK